MKTVCLHIFNILANFWQQTTAIFVKYYINLLNNCILKFIINFNSTSCYLLLSVTAFTKKPPTTLIGCFLLILLRRFEILLQFTKREVLPTELIVNKSLCMLKTIWCCLLLCWLGSGLMADLNHFIRH